LITTPFCTSVGVIDDPVNIIENWDFFDDVTDIKRSHTKSISCDLLSLLASVVALGGSCDVA